MYHPAGFGEAGERSYPARSSQRSGIRFPAPRFSPHRVLGPFRPIAVSPFRPFAVSLFRLPPLLPLSDLLLPLTSIDHEGVVIAVESPWTRGDLRGFQKFPVGGVRWLQMQIITYPW